jgi:predicted Zn finger-like uncharacterized protein
MRVACPSCFTIYDIPSERLAVGKAVRCGRCEKSWIPLPEQPPEQEPIREPAQEPAPEPASRPTPPPAEPFAPMAVQTVKPSRPVDKWLLAAWAGSAVFLIGIVAVLGVWRQPLTQLWPPIARLYGLFGG